MDEALDADAVMRFFGDAYEPVAAFASLLGEEGVLRGLLGPREPARLWERHLLNSAAVLPYLPAGPLRIVDVGSGAGLPGVVLALCRPDAQVVLVESMARRAAWLGYVLEQLRVANASVVHGRAENAHLDGPADVVTARAVASLDLLLEWAWPLVGPRGVMLALKGERAEDEIVAAQSALRARLCTAEVLEGETIVGVQSTTIVRVSRRRGGGGSAGAPASEKGGKRRG